MEKQDLSGLPCSGKDNKMTRVPCSGNQQGGRIPDEGFH